MIFQVKCEWEMEDSFKLNSAGRGFSFGFGLWWCHSIIIINLNFYVVPIKTSFLHPLVTSPKEKTDFQKKRYNIIFIFWGRRGGEMVVGGTIANNPSIFIVDHPDLIVCKFMENSMGLKRF